MCTKIVLIFLLFLLDWNDALTKEQLNGVTLIFYYGPSIKERSNYDLENSDKLSSDTTKELIRVYLERNDYNIIVFDWSNLDTGKFIFTVPEALEASFHCGNAIIRLIEQGLDLRTLHVVGFGLGAHMAVPINKALNQSIGMTLKRITGLDPTLILFYDNSLNDALEAKHAEFVDIIHTDAGLMGQGISSGTADFWPNGGNGLQPGCLARINEPYSDNDLCSHRRAVHYWAESVSGSKPTNFLALQSIDWQNFKENPNLQAPTVEMGIDCSPEASGSYYLQTNSRSPFARGTYGVRYNEFNETSKI